MVGGRRWFSTGELFELPVREQELLLLVLKVTRQRLDRVRHLEHLVMRVQRVSAQPKSTQELLINRRLSVVAVDALIVPVSLVVMSPLGSLDAWRRLAVLSSHRTLVTADR